MLKGLDVSSFQDEISFKGFDFVIIKASEGWNFVDPGLARHAKRAISDGVLYGFYHYARPDLGNAPEIEADSFISFVKPYLGKCLLALDWEQLSLNYSPKWALRWLNRVFAKTGVKPVLYIQGSEAIKSKYKIISDEDFGLWVAHWGVDKPSFNNWDTYAVWQYRGSPLDLDYFNGDKNAWYKYCGGKDETTMNENKVREIVRDEIKKYFSANDEKDVSSWAKKAVEWAMNNGIMNGDEFGNIEKFRPKALITREEVAQTIYNIFRKFNK